MDGDFRKVKGLGIGDGKKAALALDGMPAAMRMSEGMAKDGVMKVSCKEELILLKDWDARAANTGK